jgi:hypothetical protein
MEIKYLAKDGSTLFSYPNLSTSEVIGRLFTNYLVKDGKIYVNNGGKEENNEILISLQLDEHEEPYPDAKIYPSGYIGLEYRDFNDERKIVKAYEFTNHFELFPRLLLSKPIINNKQYKRCALEYDEDRTAYVLYLV